MSSSPATSSALRWFGCVLAAVFGVLAAVAWWNFGAWPARALLGSGLALAAVYYALPPLRVPMYLTWMAAVTPIGNALSRVILGAIYFGVISPIAFLMRPFRSDPLSRSLDEHASSYWSERGASGDTASYLRQS